ncbi:unnamed protein product [Arabis nemorensis]|uniref:Sodium/metabolite cotransporter BASS6, chloroplastic n=1 Tax=Arabis nemorensis TaxID=586526 RepID=A0A565CEC6_9BRAS|nr:unnamed protein product [Arabis nemorensis]
MSVISPIETLHLKSTLRLLPRCLSRSQRIQVFPPNNIFSNSSLSSPIRIDPISQGVGSRILWRRYVSDKLSDMGLDPGADSNKMYNEKASIVETLKKANSILPHVVLASTVLALLYPPSFTWFTSRYFVPALGFLMFAVGINSNEKDFLEAFKRPKAILLGYAGQYLIKPILGFIFGLAAVSLFQLPTPIGAGIMLVSCVSGAQLSNYATFLTDPSLAPLSIVMTSLSTATAVLVTPMLSLLLIGKKLPVDVKGMISSILQVVIAPIAAGLLLNKLFPKLSNAIRPFLPILSVLDTACCVGAPLALNISSVMSPFGATILLLVTMFHLSAFLAGYFVTGSVFRNAPDAKALQRTLSYETGMQSSLLALALATRFFEDPLVGIPPAVSTVVMSLMGFSLVMICLIHDPIAISGLIGTGLVAAGFVAAGPDTTAMAAVDFPVMGSLQLSEPANALSLPTWAVHVSSVVEWITAMALVWKYGERKGYESWKGLSWGMVPLLGGALCACTWHFFYNDESLEVLVALQAALTVIGNITMCIAAFRINKLSSKMKVSEKP